MKKAYLMVSLILLGALLFTFCATNQAFAWDDEDHRPFLQWLWEGEHATMINALLITANDQVIKNSEKYVMLHKQYSERDPLLEVYGLRETGDDSVKDAFLVGLKANNLIYLIHSADKNPEARKAAIKELKLLGKIVHSTTVMREFPYWAQLLEEGRYPSTRLSHIYVHYTIDIGEYYYKDADINTRFYYWLGYLVNDFTVAHLCKNKDWMKEDQAFIEKLYSIRQMGNIPRFTIAAWYDFDSADLNLKQALNLAQGKINYIKKKYTDRLMK